MSRVESGRVGKCSKFHGSGRIESGGFLISRLGSVNLIRSEPREVVRPVKRPEKKSMYEMQLELANCLASQSELVEYAAYAAVSCW